MPHLHTREQSEAPLHPASMPHDDGAETAGYLNHGAEQLYYVRHYPRGPRLGQVLLAGPFAAENEPLYIAWVRWARFLARNGLEVFRFDYRGVGESTGEFGKFGLPEWLSDVQLCVHHFQDRGRCPLILHGLGMGALLLARLFHEGVGDGLLLWSPPPSAREILQYALRRQCMSGYGQRANVVRASRQDCILELESGRPVAVDGYLWSPSLWRDSAEFHLLEPRGRAAVPYARPWKIVQLDHSAGPLVVPWGEMPPPRNGVDLLNPDLTTLFQQNCDWICQSASQIARAHARNPAR